jgi:hypothetical protein
LPEPYYAATGSRVWVEVSQRFVEPDVDVLRRREESSGKEQSNGGVAVAPRVRARSVVVRVPQDERHESFLDIYTQRDDQERLVTTIEVLSLANKTPGEQGRGLYLQKQREVLGSKTHLVEMDLLRSGHHTTAVPHERAVAQAGAFDCHVSVHCYDKRQEYVVYPILLTDTLPEILIPLLPGDPEVAVNLQTVFDRCYDTGPYRRRVRYRDNAPVPPLRPDQAEWATCLLREKGLLPAAVGSTSPSHA